MVTKVITRQKDIEGYEGKYKITENGEVLSVKNKLKILTPFVTKQGLNQISLSKVDSTKKRKVTHYFVSQLVAKAFLPDYPKDGTTPKLLHINGIKTDDRRENLKIKEKKPIYSSSYKGVIWSNSKQKWVAIMLVKRKKIELGYFNSELEASKCYLKALEKKKRETKFRQMNKKLQNKENKQLELQH